MSLVTLNPAETGLEVIDLEDFPAFAARHLHERDVAMQMEGMQRLARAFADHPDTILQELAKAAVELCGAESAGITLEKQDRSEESYYHWVAAAGQYSNFLNATLPQYPSGCAVCLERGRPQLFRASQRFFELMGLVAPAVTDGILFPWHMEELRGSILIMAHGRTEAFDGNDVRMMQVLADFAAMGVRQQRQQKLLMKQATVTAAASMANDLAHRINNPLQSLTNIVYLASSSGSSDAKALAEEMAEHVDRLGGLVKRLLSLPGVDGHTLE